jgi:predicted DNA-binding WGR domain protein
MSSIERQVVLQCIDPAAHHNKYYEISIRKDGISSKKDNYYVHCRWGRIEHFKDGNPQEQTKLEDVVYDTANEELGRIMFSKLKKGYKVFKDTASGHAANEYTAKTQAKKSVVAFETETKSFERTEHVEIAINWWNNLGEAIEDRAI